MEPKTNLLSSNNVEALLEIISDDKTRRAMKERMQMMKENQEKTDKKIMELSDFCKKLDQRLREQELYDPRTRNWSVTPKSFSKANLNIGLKGASFEACDLLPGRKQLSHCSMSAVVVMFGYFEEKKQGYSQPKLLKDKKNPIGKQNFLNRKKNLSMEDSLR